MNLPDALQFIFDLQPIGIKFGLSNTKRLLHALNDPHLDIRAIHISGTNGKGSCAAMIASILKMAGYKTGLYTSPHLIDLSERIQIDNRPINQEELITEAKEIKSIIQGLYLDDSFPTYFEAVTCMAFSYFKKQQVDFAVMEVGMGGRLDATNVCKPCVTVITSISFDHQKYLGNSLRQITLEKAGIIKKGTPLVCGATQEEVIKTLKERCDELKAPFYNTCELYTFKELYSEPGCFSRKDTNRPPFSCLDLHLWRQGKPYLTVTPALCGKFQIQNTILALETIERLKEDGHRINKRAIKEGIEKTVWPARMQLISQNPALILDGAHNPAAAQSLAEAVQKQFKYDRLILILGILKDKDKEGILRALIPIAHQVILSAPKTDRAAPPEELYSIIKDLGVSEEKSILIFSNLSEALMYAKEKAAPCDAVLITGSLYTVGDAMAYLGVTPYPMN